MKKLFSVSFIFTSLLYSSLCQADVSYSTEKRIRVATQVVEDRMRSSLPVPNWVLESSKCLASLKVMKAGFIWGGEGSTGLVSCRLKESGEWSTPSFLNVGGVSFGFQIGIQFIESVVTFMTGQGVDLLHHASVKIGTDLSFAAGPFGQGGGTSVTPQAAVFTYDKAVGLYAGATINGFVLTHGLQRNQEVYGNSKSPADILTTPGMQGPAAVQNFVAMLEKYAP